MQVAQVSVMEAGSVGSSFVCLYTIFTKDIFPMQVAQVVIILFFFSFFFQFRQNSVIQPKSFFTRKVTDLKSCIKKMPKRYIQTPCCFRHSKIFKNLQSKHCHFQTFSKLFHFHCHIYHLIHTKKRFVIFISVKFLAKVPDCNVSQLSFCFI